MLLEGLVVLVDGGVEQLERVDIYAQWEVQLPEVYGEGLARQPRWGRPTFQPRV